MPLPTISGEFRVAADPELRYAASGVAVCKIRAVASHRKKNDDDTWVDSNTLWTSLTIFKDAAEHAAESFEKGDLVVVTGRIELQEWEKDGVKNRAANVLVDSIGHSTRWATSKATKVERSGGGDGQRKKQTDNDPWAAPDQSDEPPF